MEFNGHQVGICMGALVWVKDCPFSKTHKPPLSVGLSEVNGLYEYLVEHWVRVRDSIGVEATQSHSFDLDLSAAQTACLRDCLGAVLNECDGNPLELELRVGDLSAVRELHSQLFGL